MNANPASLQTFNNELVNKLLELKEKRGAIQSSLLKDEAALVKYQQEIKETQLKQKELEQLMDKKYSMRKQYDDLITETQEAYNKIVQSSHTLLEMLNRESSSINELI